MLCRRGSDVCTGRAFRYRREKKEKLHVKKWRIEIVFRIFFTPVFLVDHLREIQFPQDTPQLKGSMRKSV